MPCKLSSVVPALHQTAELNFARLATGRRCSPPFDDYHVIVTQSGWEP